MKKGDDSPEPRSSPVATHQFSLSSLLLRTSTTSSEAKRNLFYGSSNASKASLESTASTTRLTSDPVIEEDFADVDSSNESNYSEDDARTAESIYSVIQEYELSRSSFWFSENFENSPESARSVEENRDAVVQQTLLSPRIPFTIPEEGQPERAGNASRQAILPDSRQRSPQLRGPIGLSRNIGSPSSEISQQRFGPQQRSQNLPYPNRSPLIDTHEINAFGQTPSPQVSDSVGDSDGTTSSRNSRGNRSSLSSGELLTRLEVTSCKSSLSSKRNSTNSELALQTLIAEVDLETELPVMVYSVHDKNDRQNRWSAYEKTSRASLPQETRQPPAIPIQIREGTSRARRVSVSTVSVSSPSRKVSPGSVASPENTPRARSLIQMNTSNPPIPLRSLSARNSVVRSSNSSLGSNSFVFVNESSGSGSTPKSAATGGTGPNGSSPGVFSNISGGIPENDDGGSPKDNVESTIFDRKPSVTNQSPASDSQQKSSEGENAEEDHTPIQPHLSSPAPSITTDSGERSRQHEAMFDEKANGDITYTQQPKSLNMPWSKWGGMMIAALVVVPIFFLLPFGVFDHGGFFRASERNLALDEKSVSANWRFKRRYTRVQKIISFFLGLVWILVVIAMISVGFGVGLTRLRIG